MCGIVGYIGKKNTTEILLDGLKELEYRGYDSAGIAVLKNDKIEVFKALGKLVNLEAKVNEQASGDYELGIGHTRWATHGKPTELNAHPHLGEYSYVVHNGIIENYKELKEELSEKGHKFVSQTDTEVIVHLFENFYNISNNTTEAFKNTISRLEGAFSILLITKADPTKVFFFKHGSPLIVAKGIDENEVLFASSDAPLIGLASSVVYLEDGVGGIATASNIEFFSDNYSWSTLPASKQFAQKDGFRFFMEKEIYEQSVVVSDSMLGRLRELSFRKVGEGVNKKRDTDKYDIYYQHIILWDENDLEIVGSYRIGNSDFIFKNIGVKGFYSNNLFKYNEEFTPYLKNSIELGRSFVQPKYWGTRALDYLWFGIGAYLKNNPNIKYMFGPVSMSASFPTVAKDMMIFYYSHYFKEQGNLIEAKTSYQYSNNISEIKELFDLEDKKKDFKFLKSALSNIGVTIPTLYKQYSEITEDGGVKFLSFNIDKNFADCIDGFILVEVDKIKESAKKRYIDKE